MREVSINISDVGGEAHPGDMVIFQAPEVRGATSPGAVVSAAPTHIYLIDGMASVVLEEGPIIVKFRCRNVTDSRPFHGVIPPGEGPIDLVEIIHGDFEHSPAVVSQVTSAANRAVNAAELVEQAVVSTSWEDDRLTILGVTSPSLRGEPGPPGDPGQDGQDGQVTFESLTPEQIAQITGPPGAGSWAELTDKPEIFPPAVHGHVIAEVAGLPAALESIEDRPTVSTVSGMIEGAVDALVGSAPEALDTLYEIAAALAAQDDAVAALVTAIAGKADSAHAHVVAEITDLPAVTQMATAGALVQRRGDSHISVPLSPDDPADAVAMQWVEAQLRASPKLHVWDGSGSWAAPSSAGPNDAVLNTATGEIHSVQEVV